MTRRKAERVGRAQGEQHLLQYDLRVDAIAAHDGGELVPVTQSGQCRTGGITRVKKMHLPCASTCGSTFLDAVEGERTIEASISACLCPFANRVTTSLPPVHTETNLSLMVLDVAVRDRRALGRRSAKLYGKGPISRQSRWG